MKQTTTVRKIALRSAACTLAAAIAATGMMAPAQASVPVSTDDAGTLVGWGAASSAAAQTLPESLQETAFTEVAAGDSVTLALTAAGKIISLGATGTGDGPHSLPSNIGSKTFSDVAMAPSGNGGGVTTDGKVIVWGGSRP